MVGKLWEEQGRERAELKSVWVGRGQNGEGKGGSWQNQHQDPVSIPLSSSLLYFPGTYASQMADADLRRSIAGAEACPRVRE